MGLNPNIDHLAIVAEERAKVAWMDPGVQRAWTCTNKVALRLQGLGEDAGLYEKTSGTQFMGFATDVIVYRDSAAGYDILQDSEGSAVPQFNYIGVMDASRWRPPIGDVPVPPDPPDPPDPPAPPTCPCADELAAIRAEINALVQAQQGIVDLITQGLWDAKLSHKFLGTLTGTVGPMKSS